MQIIQSPSKNFYSRQGHTPSLLVIHCTDGYFPSDLGWLRGIDPRSKVSSSYYIAPQGEVHQLVDDANGAWHAGVVVNPTAKLVISRPGKNPNWYSIGIEVSLRGNKVIKPEQWSSLKGLIKLLCDRHGIPISRDHIVGHKEIRDNKTCPGLIDVGKLVRELASPVPAPTPTPPNMVDKEALKLQIINFIKSL